MNRLTIVIFLILVNAAKAQVLTKTIPYTIASSYLETSRQIDCIPVGNNQFVSLNKIKGTQLGVSNFLLEKYDLDLNVLFSIPLTTNTEEDYKELHILNNQLCLFSEIHDLVNKKKALKVYFYNLENGQLIKEKTVDEQKVAPWLVYNGKGTSTESFESAVSGSLTYNFNTPLEYQYTIEFSPDKKVLLIYTFDYSQKTLVATTIIVDDKLEVLQSGKVSIDNNFVNYGIYVNNRQELFILNCDKLGRVVLVRFEMQTKDIILLDIQSSIAKRESFKLQFLNDDEVYVANMVVSNKKLNGIMYAKFNFKDRVVEKLNFYDLSDGIKSTSTAVRNSNKMFSGQEDWLNYQITDFYLNEYEKIIVVLEKKNIEAIGYTYDPAGVNDIKNWQERLGKVRAESVVLLSFNKNDVLLWENYYPKNQVNDILGGVLSASYNMNVSDEGKVRMLFAKSDNSAGVYNQMHYVEWDELSGNKVKDLSLTNDEGLSLLKNYTAWWEKKMVLVGKKGLLGKKTAINVYDLSSK